MNQLPVDPPRAIMQVLKTDIDQFDKQDLLEFFHYIFYNECGLAYDGFIFLINERGYKPSAEALKLIKLAGSLMGVEYPKLSTD